MTDREIVKATRDKFELELKQEDTRRPWDGLDLGKPPRPPAAGPAAAPVPKSPG